MFNNPFSQNPFAAFLKMPGMSTTPQAGMPDFSAMFDPSKMGMGFDLSALKNMFPADFMKSWQSALQGIMSGSNMAGGMPGGISGGFQNFMPGNLGNVTSLFGAMPELPKMGNMTGNVDWQSLAESQKKNMEMLQGAHHACTAGLQQMSQRLTDLFRQTMQTAAQLSTDMMATGTPEEKLGRQVDIVKRAFDLFTHHMHELTELQAKSQSEALDLFSSRLSAGLDELKDTARQAETRFHDAAVKADLNGAASAATKAAQSATQTMHAAATAAADTVAATSDVVQ